jgi:GalNAc-alpha-(1->4)-GalNAc-alpha-(1->3)-diNAcBac-PP-undecaprenol alpha-1,4-N-acetyl-D-galactosaminyltransferase
VIYNPVNEKVFSLPEMEKKDRIISVGRLYEQKNQMMMIDAFNLIKNKYPSFQLVIFGEGHLRSQLEEHIQKLGLETECYCPDVQTKCWKK